MLSSRRPLRTFGALVLSACCLLALPRPSRGDGACCFGTTCSYLDSTGCASFTGVFQGEGTTCSPENYCAGACCNSTNTSCSITSFINCETYFWQGGACSPNPCVTLGACCFTGDCYMRLQEICVATNGCPVGVGTSCTPNPCVIGACCDGPYCVQTPVYCCNLLAVGIWYGPNVGCSPSPCDEEPRGACCVANSVCVFVSESYCSAVEGSFIGVGLPCEANTCAGEGACCDLETSTCFITNPTYCRYSFGIFLGLNTTCYESPCASNAGACCIGEDCELISAEECDYKHGHFFGVWTSCDNAVCTVEKWGSCCLIMGICTDTDPATCALIGGTWSASPCSLATCDTNTDPFGACCDESTWKCVVLRRSECQGYFLPGTCNYRPPCN